MKRFFWIGLIGVGLLFGLETKEYNPMDGVKAQKAEAQKVVGNRFISVATLKKWQKEGKKFTLLDVREEAEFHAGHISGIKTLLIPRGVLYGAVKKGLIRPEQTYVIVCRTGHRALLAAATLIKWYGFANVYVLKGGIKEWIKEGGIVENSLHLGPVKINLTN